MTMRIMVINPNTTASMTRTIAAAAEAAASPSTQIIACNPANGPVSIEGHHDEAVSAIGILEEIRRGEREGVDGYVIACFGDPGLFAARELASGPVVGIAEAAMHAATFIATGFSIVTTLARTRIIAEHLVERYGMTRFCRGIRATDLAVLELEDPTSKARRIILEECLRAAKEDHSGVIILGCAGMANLATDLSREIGVPVIDGVAAAVRFVEALVSLGLTTSKAGDLAFPIPKQYTGILAHLSPKAKESTV